MSNNNYDFERNLHLTGIEKNTRGIKTAMEDKLFLEVYGKEAYIEMIEKRRFRKQLIWSGVGAFIVGFTLIGLFINGWSMSAFINQLTNIVMGWLL